MKFCELKKGNTNLKILFVAGITHHERLICCEEFPVYEREQVTVPIALSWKFRVTKVFKL